MHRLRHVLLGLGLSGFVLAACSQPASMHDKADYASNASERASTLARCEADPGRLSATPDCVNAHAADADAHTAHFYDAPKPAARVDRSGKL